MAGNAQSRATARELAGHLQDIILKNGTGDGHDLKSDFCRAARPLSSSYDAFHVMRRYASPTAIPLLGGSPDAHWRIFTDYLRKRLCMFDSLKPSRQAQVMKDILVYTGWNIGNYRTILGEVEVSDPPTYPAARRDVATICAMFPYLEQRVFPLMKNYIADVSGKTLSDVEEDLARHAETLRKGRGEGIEILLPIPRAEWPLPKPELIDR